MSIFKNKLIYILFPPVVVLVVFSVKTILSLDVCVSEWVGVCEREREREAITT
jgi:hypothetical protein